MAGHTNIMGVLWQCRQTTEGSAHHLCCDLIMNSGLGIILDRIAVQSGH